MLAPSPPWYHLVQGSSPLVLIVEGSQVFQVEPAMWNSLKAGDTCAEDELARSVRRSGLVQETGAVQQPHAISLNLAKACNLACHYCYADEGRFGGKPGMMKKEVAAAAIDRAIDRSGTRRVVVGFMGGEPFLNRETLYYAVDYAKRLGVREGVDVRFSVTTNGTLLNAEDVELLRTNRFSVTVSVDGSAQTQSRLRPLASGHSSYDRLRNAAGPLLANPGAAKVSARATVVRQDMKVSEHVECIAELGFQDVGVSPLRSGPQRDLIISGNDWGIYLAEMRRAAAVEWERLQCKLPPRFANFHSALTQIHQGTCRTLPCGAGSAYASVSAEGNYFTCHRAIDAGGFALGDVKTGIDSGKQLQFLASRHVDSQEPCRTCWARYLCGGGCHAEVMTMGRDGCDYIRGWLETCLQYYDLALQEYPHLFPGEECPR